MNAQKRILFVAEAATLAHVVRLIVLAKALNPKNYDIHFACAPGYEHYFQGAGFTLWSVYSVSQQHFLQAIAKGVTPYTKDILKKYIEDDLNILDQVKPDLLVGDNRFSLAVSAPLRNVPYTALISAHWSPYSPLTRYPMPVPEHPIVDLLGLSFARFMARLIQPLSFYLFARPLNRLRREYGLPALGNLVHVLTQPGDYTLYADTPGFSPTAGLPTNHRYIGPILWSPDIPLPQWWGALPDNRPSIYVTFGSSGQVTLLPLIIEALQHLPVNVLIATAGRIKLDSLPANVWAADYLPGSLAAQRSRLVICNGGSGTVHQALAASVPVLGIASNMDQYLVMECVTRASAGLLLRAGQTTMEKITGATNALLEQTKYRIAAHRIAEEFSAYNTSTEFPKFIEEVCN